MDNLESAESGIFISYKGENIKDFVKTLTSELKELYGIGINKPKEIYRSPTALGMPEIVITIILTAIAKTTLDILAKVIKEHINKKKGDVKLTIIIKKDLKTQLNKYVIKSEKTKFHSIDTLFEGIKETFNQMIQSIAD